MVHLIMIGVSGFVVLCLCSNYCATASSCVVLTYGLLSEKTGRFLTETVFIGTLRGLSYLKSAVIRPTLAETKKGGSYNAMS